MPVSKASKFHIQPLDLEDRTWWISAISRVWIINAVWHIYGGVIVGVTDGVGIGVTLEVGVGVTEGVGVILGVGVTLGVGVGGRDEVGMGVMEGVGVNKGVGVGTINSPKQPISVVPSPL